MVSGTSLPAMGVAVVLAAASMAGCAGNPDEVSPEAPPARQITAVGQCGFIEPGLVHMDSRQRLEAVTEVRGVGLSVPDSHDFDQEHLLLVAAGRRPTGGYGVALSDARLHNQVLEVTVEVRSPAPDQMVTQALTSPCALLAVTADGWDRIRVSGHGFEERSLSR